MLTRPASPFTEIGRERWRELGAGAPAIGYDELAELSGLGEPVTMMEVTDVYVPLARLATLVERGLLERKGFPESYGSARTGRTCSRTSRRRARAPTSSSPRGPTTPSRAYSCGERDRG